MSATATQTVQDSIVRSATYPVSQERLWRAVTEPDQLTNWFHIEKVEMDFRVGGEIMWMFTGGHISRAVIDEISPMDRFVWKWKAAGADDRTVALLSQENITEIVFLIEPVAGGTKLTITETGFAAIVPAGEALVSYNDHTGGWDGMMSGLQEWMAGEGIQPIVDAS